MRIIEVGGEGDRPACVAASRIIQAPLVKQRYAQMRMGFRQIRVEDDRALIGGNRVFELSFVFQGGPEIAIHFGNIGVDGNRSTDQFREKRYQCAGPGGNDAKKVQRPRVLWLLGEDFSIKPLRLRQSLPGLLTPRMARLNASSIVIWDMTSPG